MSRLASINTRIDSQTKDQAQEILDKLGLTMSEAIVLYFRQIVMNQAIPFEIKIPNALTAKTLEASENGQAIQTFSHPKDLYKDLGI